MKNIIRILLILVCTSVFLISCKQVNNVENTKANESNEVTNEELSEDILRIDLGFINETKITLIKGEEAANILAAEGDYIPYFSEFDYASKFKSEKALNFDERLKKYLPSVLEGKENQIKTLKKTVEEVNKMLDGRKLNLPEEITIIFENGSIEGGAAYTRASSIIFPSNRVSAFNQGTTELFIHELFHVYSRYNIDKREAMYNVIGYKKCEDLIMPDEIKDLTIANPDAPVNNYYLTCTYDGEEVSFIPVIYSKEKYDLEKKQSFFMYLNDDMLAVEVIDNVATPVRKDGELLIVEKNDLENFNEQIGRNTSYTFHPEETIADNFVFLVTNAEVPDMWVVEGLGEIIFE